MQKLLIEPSHSTPMVVFDPESSRFEIVGRSIPENPLAFYGPLYDWLNAHGPDITGTAVFKIEMEYFNTSTSKCLANLMVLLAKLYGNNPGISVAWIAEEDDEDMIGTGEDYKAFAKLPVEIVLKPA